MSGPIKHLTPADYRVMPWKNGGGSTTEIAVSPEAGEFAWRVSMADLTNSGPFSAFPGVDRIITPIQGPAFRLRHGVHGSQTVSPLVPYAFPGDWETTAELEGPGRDYNVMIRRASGPAWTEVLALGPGQSARRTYLKGQFVLTALTPADVVVAGNRFSLKPLETLVAASPGVVELPGSCQIILSAIGR